MELPNVPFFRRWSVLLAGVIGLAAIAALLGWQRFQEVAAPSTTSTTLPTTLAAATTVPPTSVSTTTKPKDVLWSAEDSDVRRSPGFAASGGWRIEWEYDCSNFEEFGVGNFKITGAGAFERVDIQATKLKASGRRTFTRGGYGHLLVESVCDSWKVTVLDG